MKMWQGRFRGGIDKKADAFNSSLHIDKRLYKQDIMGSIAHATMLGECGIIPQDDADAISKALSEIFFDIKSGKLNPSIGEDIHMFVEEELTRRIGNAGKKLHTARSRNDQVALDIRLYLRDSIDEITVMLKNLIETVIELSSNHKGTIIPAYTHMQKAQPTTLAHYLMAYGEMFYRDIERFLDARTRINLMPLGSGALTGTTYPINRARVAELLGFGGITYNTLDSVSDRDFAIEYLSCCAVCMMHLSRFNEEIIYWSSDEFGYITLPDAYSTGSSIMPQKKNPDICELIRGKTGRSYGNLMNLLTVMKGLPLAYNKDMQEDKEALFDSEDTLKACLELFNDMLPALTFNEDALYYGAGGGFTTATDCADYLVKKGMPFREAHRVIGGLVLYCSDNNLTLEELGVDEFQKFSELFENDITNVVKLKNVIANRKLPGGPAEKAVNAEISAMKKRLNKLF